MKIAYFDCFSGVSGDMTIAAFLDAGLKPASLMRGLAELKLKGYRIKISKVTRNGFAGTKFDCLTEGRAGHHHRSLKDIYSIIERSGLSPNVKDISRRIFETVGRAEAKVHNTTIDKVHLHEVGDLDSIIDIVGASIAIDDLAIDEIYSSKLTMGRTIVTCDHGMIPIPGPATMEMLKGVPATITSTDAEFVTPTGAGIVKTLSRSFGPMPEARISAVGYGAGSMQLPGLPNMLRIIIGEASRPFSKDTVTVIETNIDDMNPQIFGYVFDRLFQAGALDVYTTPIQMKKSRPAFKLSVISRPIDVNRLSAIILEETHAIGVRYFETSRLILDRKMVKAGTRFGPIGVKISSGPGGIKTVSPEYDDCARIARAMKLPFKAIYDEAKSAAATLKAKESR